MCMYDIMVLNVSMRKQYNGCLEIGEVTAEKILNIDLCNDYRMH